MRTNGKGSVGYTAPVSRQKGPLSSVKSNSVKIHGGLWIELRVDILWQGHRLRDGQGRPKFLLLKKKVTNKSSPKTHGLIKSICLKRWLGCVPVSISWRWCRYCPSFFLQSPFLYLPRIFQQLMTCRGQIKGKDCQSAWWWRLLESPLGQTAKLIGRGESICLRYYLVGRVFVWFPLTHPWSWRKYDFLSKDLTLS